MISFHIGTLRSSATECGSDPQSAPLLLLDVSGTAQKHLLSPPLLVTGAAFGPFVTLQRRFRLLEATFSKQPA